MQGCLTGWSPQTPLIPSRFMKNKIYNPFFFLLFCFPFLINAQVIYVNHAAAGQNNGSSWADAYVHLNEAITSAQFGDSIWIAQGTYFPTNDGNRDSSFVLKNGVSVFGGFQGFESNFEQRNWNKFPTILSGDIGVPGDSTDNSYNVLFGSDVDSVTVIDGFIIERGCANSTLTVEPKLNRKRGAGMYLKPKASGFSAAPVVRNCLFRYNFSQATAQVIYAEEVQNSSANIKVEHCRFINNTGLGACINLSTRKKRVSITDCFFGDNGEANLNVSNSVGPNILIIENDTFESPKGTSPLNIISFGSNSYTVDIIKTLFLSNSFGDIFASADNSLGVLNVKECIFSGNNMDFYAGFNDFTFQANQVNSNDYLEIDVAEINEKSKIRNNSFSNNHLYIYSKTNLELTNNKFYNNKNYFIFGGAGKKVRASNCVFYNNAGPLIRKPSFPVSQPCDIFFQNCSFINCTSGTDSTNLFYADGRDSVVFNSCLFTQSEGNLPMISSNNNPTGQFLSARNCIFEDASCNEVVAGSVSGICNGSNIFGAALMFYDTAGGDFRLSPCSPGINSGDIAAVGVAGLLTDLNGSPRILNGLPDAGAFETNLSLTRLGFSNVSCHGRNDGAVAYSPDACPPYNYQWVNQSGTTGDQVGALSPGTYWITVTGNYGLSLLDTVTITEPPTVWEVVSFLTPASSLSAQDGAIVIDIIDGIGPFTYHWSNGNTTQSIENIKAGTYTLTVTDAGGCTDSYTFELGTVGTNAVIITPASVYPNPIKAGTIVHLGIPADNIYLTDMQGRQTVGAIKTYDGELVIPSSLTSGIYTGNVLGLDGRFYFFRISVE